MTLEFLAQSAAPARPKLLLQPVQAIAALVAAWKDYRRRKADTALLMSMDPHVLQDIGVTVVREPYDGGSFLALNPAVLATTIRRNYGTR